MRVEVEGGEDGGWRVEGHPTTTGLLSLNWTTVTHLGQNQAWPMRSSSNAIFL